MVVPVGVLFAEIAVGLAPTRKRVLVSRAALMAGGGAGSDTIALGAAGTTTVDALEACAPPAQYAVCPVKTSDVEQPASSATVRRTV